MHKKNEINIVVAMEREAKPLINYWNLKKNTEKIFLITKKLMNIKKYYLFWGFLFLYLHIMYFQIFTIERYIYFV